MRNAFTRFASEGSRGAATMPGGDMNCSSTVARRLQQKEHLEWKNKEGGAVLGGSKTKAAVAVAVGEEDNQEFQVKVRHEVAVGAEVAVEAVGVEGVQVLRVLCLLRQGRNPYK